MQDDPVNERSHVSSFHTSNIILLGSAVGATVAPARHRSLRFAAGSADLQQCETGRDTWSTARFG
jgi:hypothetical protein